MTRTKQQIEAVEYTYRPRLRPVGYATMPSDVKWEFIEAPAYDPMIGARLGIPVSRSQYGIIATDRQLTKEERDRYGMELV